jgi:hypothetical protein
VVLPLLKLEGKDTYPLYVVIIDALDECEGENDIRIILRLLAEARSLKKVRLRVLIISRLEVPIRYGFCQIPNAEHCDFILHDIEAAIVDHDIFIFLEHEIRSIGQEWSLGAGWPGEQALRRLVLIASGLFIGRVLSRRNISFVIFVKEQWVTWGIENKLWLPYEYRPCCTAVYGSVVALGQVSGRLLTLEFAFQVSAKLLPARLRCG